MHNHEQYRNYDNKLQELNAQCAKAEKEVIVAETNLANLKQQRQQLTEECESFAGASIDKVPEVLAMKKADLDNIMTQLLSVDTKGEITEDKVEFLENLIKSFGIPQL